MADKSTDLPNEEKEEDASELNFPEEFEKAETLMISEVNMLLQGRKQQQDSKEDQ